jgi:hypothetical protein
MNNILILLIQYLKVYNIMDEGMKYKNKNVVSNFQCHNFKYRRILYKNNIQEVAQDS